MQKKFLKIWVILVLLCLMHQYFFLHRTFLKQVMCTFLLKLQEHDKKNPKQNKKLPTWVVRGYRTEAFHLHFASPGVAESSWSILSNGRNCRGAEIQGHDYDLSMVVSFLLYTDHPYSFEAVTFKLHHRTLVSHSGTSRVPPISAQMADQAGRWCAAVAGPCHQAQHQLTW